MSPEKMIGLSFAAAAAKLYEVFGQAKPSPLGEGFSAFSRAGDNFCDSPPENQETEFVSSEQNPESCFDVIYKYYEFCSNFIKNLLK